MLDQAATRSALAEVARVLAAPGWYVTGMPHLTLEQRQRWWREALGAPRFVMAPMVLQGELAYRLLARRHGCELCYSPMLPASAFLASAVATDPENPDTGGPATQDAWFTSLAGALDRPLLVQLGGSELDELVAAARLVQHRCDGIDINLGCPQRCAEQGGYGAFLLEHPERVRQLVTGLVAALEVPVTCKMRILPRVEDTVAFALMLQEAGAAAVAVHGRRREQRHHEGAADWEQIAAVRRALDIAVIANGNVRTRADAERALAATGCAAVMSATALLANPRLFAASLSLGGGGGGGAGGGEAAAAAPRRWREGVPTPLCRLEMALEYLLVAEEQPEGALPRVISEHVQASSGHIREGFDLGSGPRL